VWIVFLSVCEMGCVRAPEARSGDAGPVSRSDAGPRYVQPGSHLPGPRGHIDIDHYESVSVSSAVSKVKNLLVGLPASDADVAAVTVDQTALTGLVAQWMAMPAYTEKMMTFFATAFQQSEITREELVPQFFAFPYPPYLSNPPLFTQNLAQSFARTALELVAEGQPFTSTMMTRRFMMTPALMAAYALLDAGPVDDSASPDKGSINHALTLESAVAIPLDETIDPSSSNYLTFYAPALATATAPGCPSGSLVYSAPVDLALVASVFIDGITGAFCYDAATHTATPAGAQCGSGVFCPGTSLGSSLTAADFSNWQMVTIRAPLPGEATTAFYDLESMRAGNDLVLNIPRIGFFTTLSFFGQWATNQSNLARVTANQTLIVGLGEPIDLSDVTAPPSLAALDSKHAAPGTTCYGCHQSLDPLRQFFRQAYTLYFSAQTDPSQTSLPGQFAFHGVSVAGTSIFDLGDQLAQHPQFATAWVQKLCTYANSAPCAPDDPEFLRLVGVFKQSGFSWNALVQALFSSPLVTNLQETATSARNGDVFPMASQEHLCATLSNRLQITDVCGLDASLSPALPGQGLWPVSVVAASWPAEAYSRGSANDVHFNAPTVFTRTGLEKICATLADYLIDNPTTGQFESSNSAAAVQSFVTNLMGLGSEVGPSALAILQGHDANAQAQGASPTDALKSTFVLACTSPYVAGIGL
jgi:hypothetical protein